MSRSDLVERRREERDRRRYVVELTAAGRKARELVTRRTERTNAELLAALSPESREQLRKLLLRALRTLEGTGR